MGKDEDMEWAVTATIPEEEIKFYPGSVKGPNPEDDPESWSEWFYKHQPKSAWKDGKVNPEDLGVKVKWVKPKDEQQVLGYGENTHSYNDYITHFFNDTELYPNMEEYEGRPEFALLEK